MQAVTDLATGAVGAVGGAVTGVVDSTVSVSKGVVDGTVGITKGVVDGTVSAVTDPVSVVTKVGDASGQAFDGRAVGLWRAHPLPAPLRPAHPAAPDRPSCLVKSWN